MCLQDVLCLVVQYILVVGSAALSGPVDWHGCSSSLCLRGMMCILKSGF
jgi:hypothetical protein